MATSGRQILLYAAVFSIIGVQVNCKVEQYTLDFREKGTPVREEVNLDIDNGTEVFRVPQHNNKEPMDVMHDFVANLTARRFPSTQTCYISKLDLTLPSPQKLKHDLNLAKTTPLSSEKIIKETRINVVGFANRLAVPRRILDFCGRLPIYKVEDVAMTDTDASITDMPGQRSQKRSVQQSTYFPCKPTSFQRVLASCKRTGKDIKPSNCQMTSHCVYTITCYHCPSYVCSGFVHQLLRVCCNYVCSD